MALCPVCQQSGHVLGDECPGPLVESGEREIYQRAAEWAAQWMRDHLSGIGSPNEDDLEEFKKNLVHDLMENS